MPNTYATLNTLSGEWTITFPNDEYIKSTLDNLTIMEENHHFPPTDEELLAFLDGKSKADEK